MTTAEDWTHSDHKWLASKVDRIITGPAHSTYRSSSSAEESIENLTWLMVRSCPEKLKSFCEWGANPNVLYGAPILEAAMSNDAQLVSLVKASGADINHDYSTPLFVTVDHNDVTGTTQLVKFGADPFLNNLNGTREKPAERAASRSPALLRACLNLSSEEVAHNVLFSLSLESQGQFLDKVAKYSHNKDSLINDWRRSPEVERWAVNLLATHMDEPWAAILLSGFGK